MSKYGGAEHGVDTISRVGDEVLPDPLSALPKITNTPSAKAMTASVLVVWCTITLSMITWLPRGVASAMSWIRSEAPERPARRAMAHELGREPAETEPATHRGGIVVGKRRDVRLDLEREARERISTSLLAHTLGSFVPAGRAARGRPSSLRASAARSGVPLENRCRGSRCSCRPTRTGRPTRELERAQASASSRPLWRRETRAG
jgi:hypothetical protein